MSVLHEINNKKYLLIEEPVISTEGVLKINNLIKKYDCIYQGGNLKTSFWSSNTGSIRFLVPEENIEALNKVLLI